MEVELNELMVELLARSSDKLDDDASNGNLNTSLKENSNQFVNNHQTADFNQQSDTATDQLKVANNPSSEHVSSLNCESTTTEMNTAGQVSPFTMATFQLSSLIAQNPLLKSFIFGSFSGTCSTLLFQPFDLLKTRQQAPQLKSQNILRLSWEIIKDEKPIALWRGTVPSLIRSVPGIGLYFCTLNGLERTFCVQENGVRVRPNALQAGLFGLTARCSVGVLLMPATVIKTRLESGLFDYHNVKTSFLTIRQLEGIRGLYTGLSATLMRDAPFSAIYYMFYSQLRKLTSADGTKLEQNGTLINQSAMFFMCGLASGLLASVVTQPPDVIKTHMQLKPARYPNVRVTTVAILNEHGLSGLFRGIVPRMIRRTLMSALAWTVYEAFAQQYNLK